MRNQKKRAASKAELRALASAGLVVTRYAPDGERATVEQLTADASDKAGRLFLPKGSNNCSPPEEGG